MFEYNSGTGQINLTRGDTAYLEVSATDVDGNVLQFTDQVDIRMTVRQDAESPILFQIPAEAGTIKISPEHTSDLEFGSYRYDVQVILANGDVTTYGPYKFKVLQEVTY